MADQQRFTVRLVDDSLVVPFSVPFGDAALAGTVRPATAAELDAFYDRKAAAKPADRAGVEAAFAAAHLRSLNLDGPDGRPLPLTADVLAKLPPPIFSALLPVVASQAGVDLLGKSGSPSGC